MVDGNLAKVDFAIYGLSGQPYIQMSFRRPNGERYIGNFNVARHS